MGFTLAVQEISRVWRSSEPGSHQRADARVQCLFALATCDWARAKGRHSRLKRLNEAGLSQLPQTPFARLST
jgi:hypothetical protein